MDTAEKMEVTVPQANDVDKILDLPLAVAEGINTKNSIIRRYDFDGRQADYYLEAGEILGLVERESGMYLLTDDGTEYQGMNSNQRRMMVASKMVAVPIISIILGKLVTSDRKTLMKADVELVIRKYTDIRGTTIRRRANCVIKWLQWLGDQTGLLSVESKSIRLKVGDHSQQLIVSDFKA